jgi:hypothetical protein
MAYWEGSPDKWALISKVQQMKREEIGVRGFTGPAIRSDMHVMRNPVTGREPSKADLAYAATHLQEIYNSGAIREDRWAFLWYH